MQDRGGGRLADWLDIALWVVQFLLAVVFLPAGYFHAFRYETAKKNLPWVESLPRGVVVFDGLMEMLGGIGVVLPRLVSLLPWVTSVAAAGLAVIMLAAMALHAWRKEHAAVGLTGFLFVLAAFVAYGRWFLVP